MQAKFFLTVLALFALIGTASAAISPMQHSLQLQGECTKYVSPSGTGDCSSSAPCALSYAKTKAVPGDIVCLRSGNYEDFTDTRTTTGTDWIIYKADVGHTPVLGHVTIGTNSGSSYNAYIELDGLTITDRLYIYRRNYINIKNCDIQAEHFYGTYAVYGVWTSGASSAYITIENCEIHHASGGIACGGDNWTIKNNNIHEIAEDGIHSGGSYSLIEGNEIWDIDRRNAMYDDPGYDGIHSDGIQWVSWGSPVNVTFRGNNIHTGEMQGLFLERQGGEWQNTIVENNLIHDINTSSGYLLGDATGVHVYNNTIIKKPGIGGATVRICGNGWEMYNNIFSATVLDGGSITAHGNNIFGGVGGFTINSTERIESMNNLFVDYSNNNYRLSDSSLAINFANPAYAPATDLLGNVRDAQPDAGCYEYISQNFLYGDISGDNQITAYDASLAAHIAVGLSNPDIKSTAAAEVSGDGKVTAYDAALIAQRAEGIINKFPIEQ